jgi:hypothetical protein
MTTPGEWLNIARYAPTCAQSANPSHYQQQIVASIPVP